MISKVNVMMCIIIAMVCVCHVVNAQPTVTRQITGSDTNVVNVSLTVIPSPGTTSYSVLEYLTAETLPIHISDGGIISYSTGELSWGPFDDNLPRTITYKLVGRTSVCELAGYGLFAVAGSVDKEYTGGDKVFNLIAPIDHNITSLQPGVPYTVVTRHYVKNQGDSVINPELLLMNPLWNTIIGIRCYGSDGFVPIRKTAPDTTPSEWWIPQIVVTSVSAVPITDPAGVEVTWQFSLSSTAPWNVGKESICFAIFTSTTGGDFGPFSDHTSLTYSAGVTKTFKAPRAIYVWKEGDLLVSSPANQRAFFSFCAAPKGNGANKIESLFIAFAQSDITGAANAAVKKFIAEAHSRGFEVHYVNGIPEWSFLDMRSEGDYFINKVFAYNQGATAEQQFDSIQYDIEPHAIDTDNEPGMEPWVWREFIQNIDHYQQLVDANNAGMSRTIPFGVAIGNFWNQDYIEDDIYTGVGFQQVLDIVDKVAIMNYTTSFAAVFTCRSELEYAQLLGKQADVVYETYNTSPVESFWFNGNKLLEKMINAIEYAYVDPASPDYNTALGYNVLHYYETEGEYNHLGELKKSYRQLKPDFYGNEEPFISTYNTAPVVYVTSPDGGEVYINKNRIRLTITYNLYDDNSSVPLIARIYLVKSDGTEYYLGQQTKYLNSSTHSVSGSFTANIASSYYPTPTVFKIRIDVTEQSGTPANDLGCSDSSNAGFTMKKN